MGRAASAGAQPLKPHTAFEASHTAFEASHWLLPHTACCLTLPAASHCLLPHIACCVA